MNDGLDKVREAFDAAEDIPAPDPEDIAPPAADGPGDGPPSDDPQHIERMRKAAGFPLNDFGNGQRVALHFGEDLMFVPRVGWFVWDGTRWAKDPDNLAVRAKAQALAPLILKETDFFPRTGRTSELLDQRTQIYMERGELEKKPAAERTEDHEDQLKRLEARLAGITKRLAGHQRSIDRIRTHAKNAGNNGPLKHMLEEAQTLLARSLDDLDAAPLDVNCETALLRFSVTDPGDGASKVADVKALDHDRAHLQTKKIPVAYDPKATCPRFDAFLAEVQPDPETRAFLQRSFGLAMTGLAVQRMWFFHGSGANGKSVMVDLMAKILADYGATVRIESLTGTTRRGGGDATPDLMPLIAARLARTSEPDQGTRLQEGLIKELTGGEPIMVRALHSDFVEIRPIFKLFMSGNHKPEIRGTDDGIWRRVMMVPWEVTIPEERRNPRLVEDLMAEAPGILNWLIEGLLQYLEGGLAPPDMVTRATAEYRQESDPLGQFLAECCIVDGDAYRATTTADMKAGFDLWLTEQGMPPWKGRTFSLSLAKKADNWKHPGSGWTFAKGPSSKQAQYVGIRFTDDFDERFRESKTSGGYGRSRTPDPDDDQ
ncbi:hypothetical protein HKCCE4037_06500 [Rhodobacterales bacterium HKCCE4037]|nr:hypothetical protein [Rhodobacterales bacterium HKCCE4037]